MHRQSVAVPSFEGFRECSLRYVDKMSACCPEICDDRLERGTLEPEYLVGERGSDEVLSALELKCRSYDTDQLGYSCYDIDPDVCSGSEHSQEEMLVFDADSLAELGGARGVRHGFNRKAATNSDSEKVFKYEDERMANSGAMIESFQAPPTSCEAFWVPTEIELTSAETSDRNLDEARAAEHGFEDPRVLYLDERPATDMANPKNVDGTQHVQKCVRSTGSSISTLMRKSAAQNGGAAAGFAPATKNLKSCSYEGCPCPFQSNKWRTVTAGTAAGQQDWVPLIGKTLCDSCYSTYRKHGTLVRSIRTPDGWARRDDAGGAPRGTPPRHRAGAAPKRRPAPASPDGEIPAPPHSLPAAPKRFKPSLDSAPGAAAAPGGAAASRPCRERKPSCRLRDAMLDSSYPAALQARPPPPPSAARPRSLLHDAAAWVAAAPSPDAASADGEVVMSSASIDFYAGHNWLVAV